MSSSLTSKPNYLILLIVFLLVINCEGTEGEIVPMQQEEETDLFQWEEGQVLIYVTFIAENYWDEESTDYTYTGDTIIVTIKAIENGKVTLSHQPSERSRSFSDSTLFSFLLKLEDNFSQDYVFFSMKDSLREELLEKRFNLLTWTQSSYTDLPLTTLKNQSTNVIGWRPDLPYTEYYQSAYTMNYTLLGKEYDTLNVVVDNKPMETDGNGRTMIYSNKHGIIMSSWYSWWEGWVWGLHLVPE